MTKVCQHCAIEKPLTAEYWLTRKESRDGYRGTCRDCWYAQQRPNKRRHYHRHVDREKAKRRQWRKENPERVRLQDMRYQLTHREQIKERNKRKYWENHEQNLQQNALYRQERRNKHLDFCWQEYKPTERIDLQIWQRQQDQDTRRSICTEILELMMQSLTEPERQLLLAFESHDYDLKNSARSLKMSDASKVMERIRNAAKRASAIVYAEL